VEIELRAQLDCAKAFVVPLTHLDTHMGSLVSRPDLIEVYVRVGIDYDLPVLFLKEVSGPEAREYPALAQMAKEMSQRLQSHGLPVLDGLAQFYGGDTHEERRENYLKTIRSLKPGVKER